nr:CarD family transcriptional regulator [Oceanisphaera sp. IT1-181]
MITINQGDRIYHPGYGIGIVKSIRKKSFSGENKATFFKLYFKRNGLTWLVRANDMPNNIRSVMSAGEAKKIIQHLTSWQGKLSEQWKVRATANQAAIDKGDPLGYAEVVKGLSVMQEQLPLSATDRKHLNHSIDFLCDELADALGKPHEIVRQLIENARLSQPTAIHSPLQ